MISLRHRCEAQYVLYRRDGALELKKYALKPFSVENMHLSLVECAFEPNFCYNLLSVSTTISRC
jgi:hypothetical protein